MSTNNRNSTGSGKKKGGGFLARHAKAKGGLSEADLHKKEAISPDDILKLSGITEGWSRFLSKCCFVSFQRLTLGEEKGQNKRTRFGIFTFHAAHQWILIFFETSLGCVPSGLVL